MKRPWLNRVILPIAILVVYFVFPVSRDEGPLGVTLGLAVSAFGLLAVGALVFSEVGRPEQRLHLAQLGIALELALVIFSFGYYLLATNDPGQFVGLNTRLDAFYFSVTTVGTVGFGDIHAQGQFARALVTGQMLFNLAFVGVLVVLFQEKLKTSPPSERRLGWRPRLRRSHDAENAQSWESRYAETDQVWSGAANQTMVDVVSGMAPGRALDLGCGEGADAVWLAGQGWQVTAVDISPTAISRGQAAAEAAGVGERITWQVADLEKWDQQDEFDLVTAAFLHSPAALDRSGILVKAARLIVPGGHLLVVSHAAPPPWASGLHGHDLPDADQQVEALGLREPQWVQVLAETRPRAATGPDGQTATLTDTVVLLRRR